MAPPATKKTMLNEQQDMLAVLIGVVNIVFSIVSHMWKSSTLKYDPVCMKSDIVFFSGLQSGLALFLLGPSCEGKSALSRY
jgi:hypothetical protein